MNRKILWVFVVLVLVNTVNAISIGAGPSTLEFEKMIRGGYAEKIITVSTSGDENLTIHVEVTGSLKEWITFEPGTSFVLPEKSRFDIKAIVQPPDDAANGVYTGKIYIRADPTGTVTGGTGMVFGAGVALMATVEITGEEIVSYNVRSVTVRDIEINYPIKVNVSIQNDGNVEVKPSIKINVFSDQDMKNLLSSVEYMELEILPSVTRSAVIEVPSTGLGVGRYWTDVTSDLGGTQTLSFDVLKEGTFALKGILKQVRLNKVWVKRDETAKVSALFVNEGDKLINGAKFLGEAYLIDEEYGTEQLLGTFESAMLNVPVGKEVTLVSYFTPKKQGRYSIRGSVFYEGKNTRPKGSILNVLSKPPNYVPYYIVTGIVVILIVYYLLQKGEDGRTRRFKKIWQNYLSIK